MDFASEIGAIGSATVLATLFFCFFGHLVGLLTVGSLAPANKRQDWANLAFSSVFQIVFVCSLLLAYWDLHGGFAKDVVEVKAVVLYKVLLGYFLYDISFLIVHGTKHKGFIAHHVVAIFCINLFITHGFSSLWFNLLFAALGEGANPFLSLRTIIRVNPGKGSLLYKLNMGVLLFLYFTLRVVGFPLILVMHYPDVSNTPMFQWGPPFAGALAVWSVSLFWFRDLVADWDSLRTMKLQ